MWGRRRPPFDYRRQHHGRRHSRRSHTTTQHPVSTLASDAVRHMVTTWGRERYVGWSGDWSSRRCASVITLVLSAVMRDGLDASDVVGGVFCTTREAPGRVADAESDTDPGALLSFSPHSLAWCSCHLCPLIRCRGVRTPRAVAAPTGARAAPRSVGALRWAPAAACLPYSWPPCSGGRGQELRRCRQGWCAWAVLPPFLRGGVPGVAASPRKPRAVPRRVFEDLTIGAAVGGSGTDGGVGRPAAHVNDKLTNTI